MATYRSLKDIDWAMLILALILCAVGILQIYSDTHASVFKDAWWKQIIYVVTGLLLMWIIMTIDYHTLLGHVPILYGVTIVLLLLTFLIGKKVGGAVRWIPLPMGFLLQVSEFAKLVIVLLVARYLTELKGDTLEIWDLLRLIALVGLPMALVMKQPDLGTSLTYLPALIVEIGRASWRERVCYAV